jgi:hypothetical protein
MEKAVIDTFFLDWPSPSIASLLQPESFSIEKETGLKVGFIRRMF